MKGTLFSADFVIDDSNNPKLLEINTDTAVGDNIISERLSFDPLRDILSGSSITNLTVIHKNFQDFFVKSLETYISSSATFITSFNKVQVDDCSIYPDAVDDAEDKFILRLAYDESAVFDSTYCKSELNLYDLFYGNNDLASVVPLYHSSSTYGVIDSLSSSFNDPNIPDFATKSSFINKVNKGNLKFYKLGLPNTGSDYRINEFKSQVLGDDVVITNYQNSISGSHSRSIRSFNIVYGSDLDISFLGEYEIDSVLEVPTTLTTSSYSGSDVTFILNDKHKYEYVTNFPKISKGLGPATLILSASGEGVRADSLITGSLFTSYFISGSPDSDDFEVLDIWKIPGDTYPSGSHITSSILDETGDRLNKDLTMHKITWETGDETILGSTVFMASYDETEDLIKFRKTYELDEGDSAYDTSGNQVKIASHSLLIYDNLDEAKGYEADFSSVDTFTLSGSNVVLHNYGGAARWGYYTCFLAGTVIDTPEGDVNIEDIKVGDTVYSYDRETESKVTGEVSAIDHRHTVGSHKDACLELGYLNAGVFDIIIDGESVGLRFTPEHPFLTKGGWKSLAPLANQEPYATEQKDINILGVGDEILIDGEWKEITDFKFHIIPEDTPVFNFTVPGHNNYIAEKTVVHNK